MQQRRVRLGDILDDYCPRERRITNHAVVAMIEDEVKQTRCTTCDADHEYKGGRAPASRRRKAEGVLVSPAENSRPELIAADALADSALEAEPLDEAVTADAGSLVETVDASEPAPAEMLAAAEDAAEAAEEAPATAEDEWPVHRPLIRATLPRPEGHVPERKEPDFTMRSSRFDGQRNHRGFRAQRQAQGQQFGGPRHGSGQGGERNGNRPPQGNQRSGRPGGQGQRHGGGPNRGPKRGR
jgi:hypothetical protein